MTVPALDRDTAIARINAAAANRNKFVEALFDAASTAGEARTRADEAARAAERADTEHVSAWKDALDAGWTPIELSEGGLTEPAQATKKPRGSSSKRRGSTRPATPRRRVGIANQAPAADNADSPAPRPDAGSSDAPTPI